MFVVLEKTYYFCCSSFYSYIGMCTSVFSLLFEFLFIYLFIQVTSLLSADFLTMYKTELILTQNWHVNFFSLFGVYE